MTGATLPTLTLADARRAHEAVRAHVVRTPLLHSAWLSERHGSDVFLKCENLQRTGSFKLRGAFAAVLELTDEQRAGGVLACSAGNHGQGLALAARSAGVPCKIVVPRSVPTVKADAIRAHGAELVVSPFDGYDRTHAWTDERAAEWGGVLISAYEHPLVIAGNGGTTLLEILDEAPALASVVIPCGGGGCAIGAGVVTRELAPGTRVVAVNTDASPGMWNSRRDGRAHLALESEPTIADGIEGGVGAISFALAQRYVDDVVLARETTLRAAVGEIARREHLVVEGAGAAGVAALLDGRIPPGPTCVLLSGGNIDPAQLRACLG